MREKGKKQQFPSLVPTFLYVNREVFVDKEHFFLLAVIGIGKNGTRKVIKIWCLHLFTYLRHLTKAE